MPKELSDADVLVLLKSLPTGPCWSANMYLGSMFFMNFGERLLIPHRKGSLIPGGTSTLGVRNCYWEFFLDIERHADAASVDTEQFQHAVLPNVLGSSFDFVRGDPSRVRMDLILSNGSRFELDVTGRWEKEDIIAEITLANGQYVQLAPFGNWLLSESADLYRRHRWSTIGNSGPS